MSDESLFLRLGEALGDVLAEELATRDARIDLAGKAAGAAIEHANQTRDTAEESLAAMRRAVGEVEAALPAIAEDVDALSESVDELHAQLKALREAHSASVAELRGSLVEAMQTSAERAKALEDLAAALSTRLDAMPAALDEAAAKAIAEVVERAREAADALRAGALAAYQTHAEVAQELRSWLAEAKARETVAARPEPGPPGPPGFLDAVQDYTPGEICEAGAVRRGAGGVYQARERTYDPPGDPDSDAWQPLALDGAPGADGLGFNVRGAFRSGEIYDRGDVVIGPSGAAWYRAAERAQCDALPGPGWRLLLKRGERGRQGKQGDKGDEGPPGTGIDDASIEGETLLLYLTDGSIRALPLPREPEPPEDAVPLRWFRGAFDVGKRYAPGDAVRYGGALWTARAAPPPGVPPGALDEDESPWVLVLEGGA